MMASSVKKSKGVVKELNTFLKWGKSNVIGHNVETLDSKKYVTKIWCKLCAKYKNQVINHPTIKAAAVNAVKALADCTIVVTKFQVG